MKRFTETAKWDDPWFFELSPTAKLLWFFLCDHCDCAGVIEISLKIATSKLGQAIKEDHLAELSSRLKALHNGKSIILSFIRFQYGSLSRACKPHLAVFTALSRHGLEIDSFTWEVKGLTNPTPRVPGTLQEKEKEKEKVQDQDPVRKGECREENHYHPDSRTVLYLLNESTGRHYRETDANLAFISARLSEQGVTLGGVKLMLSRQCKRWAGTEQAEYLRPETLFNKTKFDGYYAAKDLPVEKDNGTHQHNPQSNGRRLTGAEQRQVGIPPSRGLGAAEIVRLRTAQKQRERDALQAAQNGVATAPVQPQCP